MNLFDLKANIMDANIQLEAHLKDDSKITYDKTSGFIFSSKTQTWSMVSPGLEGILVHPMFYKMILPNAFEIMIALKNTIEQETYDVELFTLYQVFKNNLYLTAKKLLQLDKDEEAKGVFYLTGEQIINTTLFHYIHLYCIYLDMKLYSTISENDQKKYQLIIDQYEYLMSSSQHTVSMLTEAYELDKTVMPDYLIEIFNDEEAIEDYRKILCYPQKSA